MWVHWLEMRWLIGWRRDGSLIGDVVAHLVEDVVSHGLEMLWLTGWRCSGSLVGDVGAHWLEIWWLIG